MGPHEGIFLFALPSSYEAFETKCFVPTASYGRNIYVLHTSTRLSWSFLRQYMPSTRVYRQRRFAVDLAFYLWSRRFNPLSRAIRGGFASLPFCASSTHAYSMMVIRLYRYRYKRSHAFVSAEKGGEGGGTFVLLALVVDLTHPL